VPDAAAPPATTVIEFEETLIRVDARALGEDRVKVFELPDLFQEANDYLVADDFANALRLYRFILENFEDDAYRRVTTYNSGLACEGLADWTCAASAYRQVLARWPASDDARFAFERLGISLWQLGEYEAIPAVVEAQLQRADISLMQEVDAHLLLGSALLELRRFTEAQVELRRVLTLNERGLRAWSPGVSPERERPHEANAPEIARAHFGIGRVYHELFSRIRLVLPQDRLKNDLLQKTALFGQAQEAYLDAVRTGNPDWAPAGGFMVGQLYEDFYFDVLASEVPRNFTPLQLEVYFEELRRFIRPAMEKARRIYELNVGLAQRLGARGSWLEESEEAAHRVRDYVSNQSGWESEQSLVVAQLHPHSARFTDTMQFREDATDQASAP
jgi:tetratricopeptide (TPR) repeat protein